MKEADQQNGGPDKREEPGDKAEQELKSGPDLNILALNSPALSEESTCIVDFAAKNDSNRT